MMNVEALRGSPLLGAVPEALLDELASGSAPVELADGEVLMEEGGAASAMYVVLDGGLEVRKRADGGDQVMLGTIGAGELVGELSLVHGGTRTAQLRARGATRLLRIPADAFDQFLTHPGVARMVLATATSRLRRQELLLGQHGRMVALGTLTAGLLHELNNPAAAVRRAVDHLAASLQGMDEADAVLASAASPALRAQLADAAARTMSTTGAADVGSLARADAEDDLRAHLDRRGVPRPWELAGPLVEAGLDAGAVDAVLGVADPKLAGVALGRLAARVTAQRLADDAAAGAARIAEIVGAVKAYSHQGEAPVQDVVVHDGLDAAMTLLGHKLPSGVRVVRRYAADLPTVVGHPGDLNGVWTNLLDNAIDAVAGRGTIEVVTSADSEQVTVAVIDDGPGIPPEVLQRVFDPFFTTKPVGAGTGLGLATAHAVITQRHGGSIDIESEPGRTAVTVTLPGSPSRQRQPAATAAPARGGEEREAGLR